MRARKTGTPGNIRAGDYIKSKMESFGYVVDFQEFNIYKESLSESVKRTKIPETPNGKIISKGRNIICERKNSGGKKKIIFSAHYDTTTDNKGSHDNGAAVAMMMEAARILENAKLPYEPVFVFFDCEETGLYGSRIFLYRMTEDERNDIIANINSDLVGNKLARKIYITVRSEMNKKTYKPEMIEDNIFLREARRIFPNLTIEPFTGGVSDDASFIAYEIPNTRYTTADLTSKDFDWETLRKEKDSSFVDLDMLYEDAKFILAYANELNTIDQRNLFWIVDSC